jgi:hypothetical protein
LSGAPADIRGIIGHLMAHDVFVSYSSKDKPTADAVCATLEGRGIRCWVAPRDILPGTDWGESIIDAIEQSRVMILIFSGHANESPQIKREVERAVNKNVTVVPLRIENVRMSKSLEYFVSTPHWMDALNPPLEQHLNHLADTLKLLLSRPGRVSADSSGSVGPNVGPTTGMPPAIPGASGWGGAGAPNTQPPPPAPQPGYRPAPFAAPAQRSGPQPPPGVLPYGTPPAQPMPLGAGMGYPMPVPQRRLNWAALSSILFGTVLCWLPYVSGVLAILLGIVGVARTRNPQVGGRGLSIAGILLGLGGLLFWGLAGGGLMLEYSQDHEARPYAQQFLQDISNGKIDAAASSASGLSQTELQDLYDEHFEKWGPLQRVDWANTMMDSDTPGHSDLCAVKGDAHFQNSTQHVWMIMEERGSTWKVTKFEVR